ncbi:MAG: transcription-repair coupling factor, transcription-repair coupling factor (superfamily II helicase) [candidate division Kazan bacterium GW2011_GWA1_50_15]|uniref:Transcription-repair-coupling factor n=2 Tax=Bacteria division Kazan-3B-28 TaxID=1798534 RepID=A0A0G1X736_UNCK3|nr:MAG: transcription-repair coupling factor, transcription-repair coupling factor (superfamily II helicase) [candidate division Kazan bacterium GW2011_GWA1_50_15]KKW25485.1 MAG: Transcription-repair coupling factor [candidate division Kazan bacterium GW2011_GWC1_52_13]KKW26791.1 MAG: Transcription-repair coupling factor [candidate division Kazan bacterium GW2011_GWB1_52_7]HAV65786.1 transcription-repair coupling factor [Patescibacteria group bacterium]HCR42804.1 transcription-repair coupling f
MADSDFYASIREKFAARDSFKTLRGQIGKQKITLTGLNQFGRSLLLAALTSIQDKSIVFITKSEQDQFALHRLMQDLWGIAANIYPPLRSSSLNREEFIENFKTRVTMSEQLAQPKQITIFTGKHLIEPLTAPAASLDLRVDQTIGPTQLVTQLIGLGFERQTKTFQAGEVSQRGEVVDVFPIFGHHPLRITFAGDRIEKIYSFEPINGTKIDSVAQVTLAAIKIKAFAPSLVEHLGEVKDKTIVVLDHTDEIMQSLYEMFVASENTRLATINKALDDLPLVKIEAIASGDIERIDFDFFEPPIYASQMDRLTKDIQKHLSDRWQIGISTDKTKSLTQLLKEADITLDSSPAALAPVAGIGTISPSLQLMLLTDDEIFAITADIKSSATGKQQRLFLAEIARGDYIVHNDHGIGRLLDIQKLQLNGVEREYLIVEYAKGDKLYVPIDQIDKVSKYISVDGRPPQLTRLSSQSWKRVISRIRKESHKFAKELLDLYAKRQLNQGISFNSEELWEKALADTFAFEETPDQESVINEILRDMEKDKPMDRLLVADVGFGKTEVAIRAAFKAITSGYQVAYLAPTTILVEQQYKTFTERLKPFSTRVAALSRFKSKGEQDQVVAQLKLGEVDIVIGTHRLLSKDIKFKNLGLVVIDEEQRFGVAHKEKLKQLRSEVDVLSLTATPIPRTLNLALSGIRDISIIETPPTNRLPIITTVSPYTPDIIQQAVEKEIKRGGQVYFVHNRVQTIDTVQHKLEKLMPEIKFIHAHGQMSERLLAKIMQSFNQNQYDVLIASTIIENGLDNPNVNTLLVDDAGHFGLSQLHQLRGRIGRGKVQAYAYFLYNKGKLSPKALERLKTIQENTELGSGYNISMRDMQIRGAGGVLSREQHGHITAIGLSLYTKLLNKAIEEMRTGNKIDVSDVTIDLPVAAYLPVKYVDAESQRLKIYQTLGVIENTRELEDEFKRIEENHGKLPVEVINLKKLLRLKLAALATQQITSIAAKNLHPSNVAPKYQITIHLATPPKPKMLEPLLKLASHLEVGEKYISFPHTDLASTDWLEALTALIGNIKKT